MSNIESNNQNTPAPPEAVNPDAVAAAATNIEPASDPEANTSPAATEPDATKAAAEKSDEWYDFAAGKGPYPHHLNTLG